MTTLDQVAATYEASSEVVSRVIRDLLSLEVFFFLISKNMHIKCCFKADTLPSRLLRGVESQLSQRQLAQLPLIHRTLQVCHQQSLCFFWF
jgi:hypothetical protein